MAKETSVIARRYCRENPDAPARTIARMLCNDYPLLFRDVECARDCVRAMLGLKGERVRKKLKDKSLYRKQRNAGEFKPTPPRDFGPREQRFHGNTKWLIISDAHIPFHDANALAAAINFGIKNNCDGIYCNGDMADNSAFSRWFKYPRHITPREDMEDFITNMRDIAKYFERRVFKIGNHDERYDRYIAHNAQYLDGLKGTSFIEVSGIDKMGFAIVESMQIGFIGKLPLLHGHELARGIGSPVSAARGAFLKTHDSILISHYHKTSAHIERMALKNQIFSTRSIGCLCSLSPAYQALTGWNHGFAICQTEDGGAYELSNFVIDDKYRVYRA